MTDTKEPTHLEVTVIDEPEVQLPIKLDDKAMAKLRKQRRKDALAEAREFEYVGAKIIKIKNKVLAKIGSEIEKHGVKKIGHGWLASAGQHTSEVLAACDKYMAELLANNPNTDPETILSILNLKKDLISQQIQLGDSHIKADRQASEAPKSNSLQIPFPAGQSMTISTGTTAPAQIELKNAKA